MPWDKQLYKQRLIDFYTVVNANTDPNKPNADVIAYVAEKFADALEEYIGNFGTVPVSDVTDIPTDIVGAINSLNRLFKVRYPYVATTLRLYLNGQRMIPGSAQSFTEVSPDHFELNFAPRPGDKLLADYKRV